MATCKAQLPEDLIKQLDKALADMDSIAEAALSAGAKVLRSAADDRLGHALAQPRRYPKRGTGELRQSLGVTPIRVSAKGIYDVRIGLNEPRRIQPGHRIGKNAKGGGYYVATNAMVGNILENGHKGTVSGQAAAPWFTPALKSSKTEILEIIRATVEARLSEIFK